jgi:hypothetical protein
VLLFSMTLRLFQKTECGARGDALSARRFSNRANGALVSIGDKT